MEVTPRPQIDKVPHRSRARSLYPLPLVIVAVGLLGIALFIAVIRINTSELKNFHTSDALKDIQILTTRSHLWLEEALGGDAEVDITKVWADLNLAIATGEALLQGGKSARGLLITPLSRTESRLQMEHVNTALYAYHEGVMKKSRQNMQGFLGMANDADFDAIFRRIEIEAGELERMVEKNQLAIELKSRRFVTGIFFSWIVVLGVATWGLWKLGLRRLAMEESLKIANSELYAKTEELTQHREHLLELVDERTRTLTISNQQLQQEIAERKKMHEALLESQETSRQLYTEFNTLAKAISDPIALLSSDLEVLWTNNIPGPCTGDGDAYARGQKCHSSALIWTQLCEGCSAQSCFASGHEETSQSVTSDGRTWEVRAYPVKDEEGRITNVLTISTDITQKVKLQAKTMRAAHLASLGEMAAGVAHEINNPINGVINYAQMLIDERKKTDEEYDIENRILKEGRRIAGIVKSLLSFAREGKELREYVDIHEIFSDTLALSAAQLNKDGIVLHVNIAGDLPRIFAHYQQMQQVFLNLINNARYALNQKFVDGNGNKVLTISAAPVSKDAADYIQVTFYDEGTGIPADIVNKIFNPFFSTKPRGAGTGLGLSISHGIITDHGGEIIIDSREGKYTKIDILLPTGTQHG